MSIEEFYDNLSVDSNSVISRLGNLGFVLKYLEMFREDDNFANLKSSLDSNDYQSAFAYAHTLKGICLNLDFGPLSESMVELTELLRNYTPNSKKNMDNCYINVTNYYNSICDAIQLIEG